MMLGKVQTFRKSEKPIEAAGSSGCSAYTHLVVRIQVQKVSDSSHCIDLDQFVRLEPTHPMSKLVP
jgi:hypothetical protein